MSNPVKQVDHFEKLKTFVSRETFEKFNTYKTLLEKWQKNINLVSNNSLEYFWDRHLLDSLQLVQHIPCGSNILDVGSGGGFPGAVLAITEKYDVTCIDSDFKKCCFLRELFGVLNVKANIINNRVENIFNMSHSFDIITARGFSDISNLLYIVERFNAIGVFLKGKNVNNELSVAKKIFAFKHELIGSTTSSDGVILVVKECRKK